MLVPLAMLAFGKVNAGDLGWSEYLEFLKWVAMTGAGICATVAGWYTAKRSDLKKTLTGGLMVLCVLGLLAAPVLAGTVIGASDALTPAAPKVATTSEASQPAAQDGPEAAIWRPPGTRSSSSWGAGAELQGPDALTGGSGHVHRAEDRSAEQIAQGRGRCGPDQILGFRAEWQGQPGGRPDGCIGCTGEPKPGAERLSNVAYGGGQGMVGGAASYAPASRSLTKADIRQAVKEEIEANKTWWDKAHWWAQGCPGGGRPGHRPGPGHTQNPHTYACAIARTW